MMRLIVILGLLAPPALADVTTPSGKVIECYCTDSKGGRVEMGEEICLYVDGRAFIARCEMALNNPIWRDTGKACVSSHLPQSLQPALDPGAVDAQI